MQQHQDLGRRWGALWDGVSTRMQLWAPDASRVGVVSDDGSAFPMQAHADGWHTASLPLPPGSLYMFSVDGLMVPDPAARCQPGAVDGWSAVDDPRSYAWRHAEWRGRPWTETVLYELHVGTFSAEGTFLGALPHLAALAALGVTMVELMPVNSFPGSRNWGYDGVLPYAPDSSYGTPDELRRLVDECHGHGMSVVLDVVCNHFGPLGNYLHSYAPDFFTERHATPWGAAIDFDGPRSAAVRSFFVDSAAHWIADYRMDGLRLDAVQAIFDDGPCHVLLEMAQAAQAAGEGRQIHLTLENDGNQARWMEPQGGYRAQWNDDFHHVMRVLVAGRTDGYYSDYTDDVLGRLGTALAEGFSYQGGPSRNRPGLLRGTPSAHLSPTAFVNFLQNHDQVGNTLHGARLHQLASPEAVRAATAVLLLGPGIPMLFMGEEWVASTPFEFLCDYGPPLDDAVRNGRRSEFAHLPEASDPAVLAALRDPNARSTRDACTLDRILDSGSEHAAWTAFHSGLLAVRRKWLWPVLPLATRGGTWRALGERALEVSWPLDDGRALVMAASLGPDPAQWTPPPGVPVFHLSRGPELGGWDVAVVIADGPAT